MNDIEVRLARVEDAEAIHALAAAVQDLHAAALPELFKGGGGARVAEITARLAASAAQQRYWVAVRGTTIVGHAYARLVEEPESLWRHAHREAILDELAVAAEERSQGIGARLWAAVREWAEAGGAARVVVNVWGFNAEARRFYVREGFAPFHERLAFELGPSGVGNGADRSGAT